MEVTVLQVCLSILCGEKKNVTYLKKKNKNGDLSYTSVIYIEREMISSNRERNIAHKGMMKLGKYIGKSPKLN